MIDEKLNANIMDPKSMFIFQLKYSLIPKINPNPMRTPITPPSEKSKVIQLKIDTIYQDFFAPIDMQIPISFVLSVTVTSIMFIIPILQQ